jgi:F-type H+-transporting ATPase subunit gamma
VATLRGIKRRIASVKSTQQITRAMKMVAAAKLRKAQEQIMAARPYAYKIDEMIKHLVGKLEVITDPLLEVRPTQRVLIVAVTADRGLCGSFNTNIIKRVQHQIDTHKDKEITLVCVGRKSFDFFRKQSIHMEEKYIQFFNNLEYIHAQEITEFLVNYYKEKKADLIEIVYNEFKNAVQQNIIVETYLPLKAEKFQDVQATVDYLYEPDKLSLLNALLPKHLNMQTWRILLESNASEQGARMTAMENATDNAADMIRDLTLHYNKARQASITKEISEIVGGSEALKSAS